MQKQIAEIQLRKEGYDNYLTLKIAPEIEDFFRRAAEKDASRLPVEISERWRDEKGNGLPFYIKNERLSDKVEGFGNVIDNFGNGLLDENGKINLALLRIVDASKGVTIKTDDLIGYEEAKVYSEGLATWAQKFYESNLTDRSFKSTIMFEV